MDTHEGNGNLNFINISYAKNVVPGEIEPKNSIAQLSGLKFAAKECLENNFDALESRLSVIPTGGFVGILCKFINMFKNKFHS